MKLMKFVSLPNIYKQTSNFAYIFLITKEKSIMLKVFGEKFVWWVCVNDKKNLKLWERWFFVLAECLIWQRVSHEKIHSML